MQVWFEKLLSTLCAVHMTLNQFQKGTVVVTVAPIVYFILLHTFRLLLKAILLNFDKKLKFTCVLKCICCVLRGPGGKRIVDVVPGGTELQLKLRRTVGQAAHACNNPHVKCTAVYCA